LKTRIVAAGTHLLLSAIVIFLSLNVIYFIWYPEPFYELFSVYDAVKIVFAVDLVLGPFLTLIVYNTSKSRKLLVRDISTILVFQISALIWGLHITYKVRPLFFVFQGNTFYAVIKSDINVEDLQPDVTAPLLWQGPKTVYIEPLKGEAAISRMAEIVTGGDIKGEMYQAEKYKPLSLDSDNEYRQAVIKQAIPHNKLLKSRAWGNKVKSLLVSHNGNIEDYFYYPVLNDMYNGLIIFKKSDFSFSGLINSEKW